MWGGSSHEGETASPKQGPAAQVADADAVAALKQLGAAIEQNDNGEVVAVNLMLGGTNVKPWQSGSKLCHS